MHDCVNQNNLYDVTLCRFFGGEGRDKIQLIFGQTISFGTAFFFNMTFSFKSKYKIFTMLSSGTKEIYSS